MRLVCLLVLAAVSSRAADWKKLATPHFTLYTTGAEKNGREALAYFERAREFFATAGSTRGTDAPVRIIAFQNSAEYQPYRGNEAGVAFYVSGDTRDYIVMSDLAPEHYPIAIHEYTHLVASRLGLHLPVWLSEGWADLNSTLKPKGNKAMVGDLIPGRAQTLKQAPWITLSDLVAVDNQSPLYNERDRAGMFYAESWALTHMLMLAPDYSPHFGAFVQSLSTGKSFAETCDSVLHKSEMTVESDLQNYLNRNKLFGAVFDTS